MSRFDLTEFEWRVITPLLPNMPRGNPRVDDRRVLNGIFFMLRSGMPWRDLPERYGPYTTAYSRFNRWREAGVWDRIMDAITEAYDGRVRRLVWDHQAIFDIARALTRITMESLLL